MKIKCSGNIESKCKLSITQRTTVKKKKNKFEIQHK